MLRSIDLIGIELDLEPSPPALTIVPREPIMTILVDPILVVTVVQPGAERISGGEADLLDAREAKRAPGLIALLLVVPVLDAEVPVDAVGLMGAIAERSLAHRFSGPDSADGDGTVGSLGTDKDILGVQGDGLDVLR